MTTTRTTRSTNDLNRATATWPPAVPTQAENWRLKTMLVGTAVGAALGLTAAWLLARASEETRGGPPHISTSDALKVGITTIGLIRAIAGLGDMR